MNTVVYDFSQNRTQIYCTSMFVLLALWAFVLLSQSMAVAGTVMDTSVISTSQSSPEGTDFGPWKKEDTAPQSQDPLWQKGTSAQDLLRKKNPLAPSVAKGEENSMGPQQVPAQQAQEESGVSIAGGAIQGDSEVMGSSWHAPHEQEPIIDEDMLHDKRDVVGAYGQVMADDDFEMSMGPELHIPGEGADVLGKDGAEASELGMSMKFKWGF